MREALEHGLEKTIFATRWLLAPMYLGLVAGLVVVTLKFFAALWDMISHLDFGADKAAAAGEASESLSSAEDITVAILSLIDIALLGNLILIVIFAGYENFVSKMKVAENSEDRPSWMGHVDFSGLKMKLIGSLVAISVILLLKDFVEAGDGKELDYHAIGWRIGLHFTFVVSGLLFAVMDYWGAKRQALLAKIHDEHHLPVEIDAFDPQSN